MSLLVVLSMINSYVEFTIGWLQSTIGFGERSSSATGYLTETTVSRRNLEVLVGARVTKLSQTGTRSKTPVMLGLEVADSAHGKLMIISVRGHSLMRFQSSPCTAARNSGGHPCRGLVVCSLQTTCNSASSIFRLYWDPPAPHAFWHRCLG